MEKIKNCVSQIHQFLTALKYRVSLEVKRYERIGRSFIKTETV